MKYLISILFVFILAIPAMAMSLEDEAFCKNISYEIGKYYIAFEEGGVPAEMLIDNILAADSEATEEERRWYVWAIENFTRIPEDTKFTEYQIQSTTLIRCIKAKLGEE